MDEIGTQNPVDISQLRHSEGTDHKFHIHPVMVLFVEPPHDGMKALRIKIRSWIPRKGLEIGIETMELGKRLDERFAANLVLPREDSHGEITACLSLREAAVRPSRRPRLRSNHRRLESRYIHPGSERSLYSSRWTARYPSRKRRRDGDCRPCALSKYSLQNPSVEHASWMMCSTSGVACLLTDSTHWRRAGPGLKHGVMTESVGGAIGGAEVQLELYLFESS